MRVPAALGCTSRLVYMINKLGMPGAGSIAIGRDVWCLYLIVQPDIGCMLESDHGTCWQLSVMV